MVDALGRDLGPPSPFDRVIQAHHYRPLGRKSGDQQPQQHPADCQPRPHRAVEHPMHVAEPAHLCQPHHPQRTADHPPARRQDAAGHQDGHILPGARGKQGSKV